MPIKKNTLNLFLILFVLSFVKVNAQNPSVYKIDDLLKRIYNTSDTIYVVNFWATWCKPCVAELPGLEKIHKEFKNRKMKVLLVSMDFIEERDKKLKEFLKKNNYTSEVVLLDEINGNDFIDKISKKWSGAIPATLIVKNKWKDQFYEGKMTYEMIEKIIEE